MLLSSVDKRIIAALCEMLPESLTPFEETASRLGISEEELLERIKQFQRFGVLRRFGAVVKHREIGFRANAMAVWEVPEEKIDEAARAIISSSAVSHCYHRQACPSWPFNLYAMIHGKTREECERVASDLSRATGIQKPRLLFSVREFKKSSPTYFRSVPLG
jgi:DNA-binding Lrp family transcriptional regulator